MENPTRINGTTHTGRAYRCRRAPELGFMTCQAPDCANAAAYQFVIEYIAAPAEGEPPAAVWTAARGYCHAHACLNCNDKRIAMPAADYPITVRYRTRPDPAVLDVFALALQFLAAYVPDVTADGEPEDLHTRIDQWIESPAGLDALPLSSVDRDAIAGAVYSLITFELRHPEDHQ